MNTCRYYRATGKNLIAQHPHHTWQDAEDAKGGLYNWFARSQQLLTPSRLMLGTLAALGAASALPWPSSGLVCGAVLAVTVAAGYYGNAVIGGVVGDYLGATIQVRTQGTLVSLSATRARSASRMCLDYR